MRAAAERIWWAGVHAVQPAKLIPSVVQIADGQLQVGDETFDLAHVRRLAIVGAGKASAGMAVALEEVLGERLLRDKQAIGWVNVPADCILPTRSVHLQAARPAGVNEPRPEGVAGAERILEIVSSLSPDDLCICLISGGGSALLPAPVLGIALEDKIRVARVLAAAGANITQLNTLRSALSRIKGGGLARACRAGRLVALIISDVLGDPLELIASGPTVDSELSARDTMRVLEELRLVDHPDLKNVAAYLRRQSSHAGAPAQASAQVFNLVIANNATAVDAAGCEAERLGFSHAMIAAIHPEGAAEDVGRHLADMALRMRGERGPDCLISGGEPTVKLVAAEHRGKGGRNQQLALAALAELGNCDGIALLSAGTDGEDGPTDAAGAVVTSDVVEKTQRLGLNPADYLQRNDAFNYFAPAGGLLKTGPTQTNVCDLRVVVTNQAVGAESP
ncbi:MAG: glycerate kinase [Pirellulales bacterium]